MVTVRRVETLLAIGTGFAALVALPIVILLCDAIVELPVVGVVATALLAIAAIVRFPVACAVGEHCGLRLAWVIFGFIVAIAAVTGAATVFAILRRWRPPPPDALPKARLIRRRRDQAR